MLQYTHCHLRIICKISVFLLNKQIFSCVFSHYTLFPYFLHPLRVRNWLISSFFLFLPSFRSMSTKNNSTFTNVEVELMIYCIVVYRPKAYMSLLHELNHVVTSWFGSWCFVRIKNTQLYNPRALKIRSLASLISWNFFSAALRTSSPRAATLSG